MINKATTTQNSSAKIKKRLSSPPSSPKKKKNKKPSVAQPSPAILSYLTTDVLIDGMAGALIVGGIFTGLAMLSSNPYPSVQAWLDFLGRWFGVLKIGIPWLMIFTGGGVYARYLDDVPKPPWYRLLGGGLLILALFGFLALAPLWQSASSLGTSGGLLGFYIAYLLVLALGSIGAVLALGSLGVIGLLFLFELSLHDLMVRTAGIRQRLAIQEWSVYAQQAVRRSVPYLQTLRAQTQKQWNRVRTQINVRRTSTAQKATPTEPKPLLDTLSLSPATEAETLTKEWQLPPWRQLLIERDASSSGNEDVERKTQIIQSTLELFGLTAEVVAINQGPTVTQYGLEPGFVRKRIRGQERDVKVKVSSITRLSDDLALALSARSLRIEAPVPGKGYIGLEVPNDEPTPVTLRGVMASPMFQKMKGHLKVALGRDVMGQPLAADLSKMPHLLIAGATGAGKSVCLNTIICSLLCQKTPDELRLLMIDPKMVELVGYNGIPHLIVPVVTEFDRAAGLFRWAVSEMERRYQLFSESQTRNLAAYNQKRRKEGGQALPYLVLIVDELADLMMVTTDDIEPLICRLAQMARATGIHLILATQRPSVNVVTGLIKANFPARIAFSVTSQIDSRVVLDRPGAEALLGRGDMLYMASDSGRLVRAQGSFVSDKELDAVTHHWQKQAKQHPKPNASLSLGEFDLGDNVAPVQAVLWDELLTDEEDEKDELMIKARELVAQTGKASVSLLQRRLRIGYARAARLVDLLEEEGMIGRHLGPGKARKVYSDDFIPGSDDDPGYDPSWVDED